MYVDYLALIHLLQVNKAVSECYKWLMHQYMYLYSKHKYVLICGVIQYMYCILERHYTIVAHIGLPSKVRAKHLPRSQDASVA